MTSEHYYIVFSPGMYSLQWRHALFVWRHALSDSRNWRHALFVPYFVMPCPLKTVIRKFYKHMWTSGWFYKLVYDFTVWATWYCDFPRILRGVDLRGAVQCSTQKRGFHAKLVISTQTLSTQIAWIPRRSIDKTAV